MRKLIRNISSIWLTGVGSGLIKGASMSNGYESKNAWILIENDTISDIGTGDGLDLVNSVDEIIELEEGQHVLPAWCDSHTHIVYHSSREGEYVGRIKGLTYEQISESGGGILNSAAKLQKASFEELFEQAERRLLEVRSFGTGTIEIKSGYGLTVESEIKMLQVIRALKEKYNDMIIKSTFLGAHAFPKEFKENREAYINLIIDTMLPKVVDEGLADYVDVFCDKGFFTVDQTRRILEAALKKGLKSKIHANELANSGGVQIGDEMGSISVDHLESIGDEEIEVLKNSNTIPTCLPGTSFFLGIPYAPARKMIDAGLGVAMATDYNPGSTPSGNMPFMLSIACLRMKLLPIEAITAVTQNGAAALESDHIVGSIDKGKKANLIVTKSVSSLDYITYSYGSNHIDKVMIGGKWV